MGMMKFKVLLIKKTSCIASIRIEHDIDDPDEIADKAWEEFNKLNGKKVEYDYYTKVERVY